MSKHLHHTPLKDTCVCNFKDFATALTFSISISANNFSSLNQKLNKTIGPYFDTHWPHFRTGLKLALVIQINKKINLPFDEHLHGRSLTYSYLMSLSKRLAGYTA